MRIGIDGRIFLKPGSGIVRYSFELTQYLIENHPEHEFYIYVYRHSAYADKIKFRGKYIVRETSLHPVLWRSKLFTDQLDRDGINAFHSMHFVVPYVPTSLRKVAVLFTCHGIMPNDQWASLKDELYWRPNLWASARFSDRVICVSEDSKNEINRRYHKPLEQMDVGYFGLAEDMKPLNESEKKAGAEYLSKKYGINGDFILYVGGTPKNKNIPTVLRAWKLLKEQYKFDLPIVISRVEYKTIGGQLDSLGLKAGKDVIAIPWIANDDIHLFYSCAAINLYASLFEGLGFPIVEAMACASPVILSNISALPEAAGGAGVLVDRPLDPKEWAEKIHSLYNDKKERERLIGLGLERAKRFTWEVVANDAIKSYAKAWNVKQGKTK
jgi:glycosyltransferase involved in cell wall biosynthesis